MVFTNLRTKTEKKQKQVDVQEAYNLWGILQTKYVTIEKLKIWENFTHDMDLKLILARHLKEIMENATILEKEMTTYGIKGPGQNRYAMNAPVNPEAVHDQFIADDFFVYLQEHVENLLRAFRTSMNNDSVRGLFKKLSVKTINQQNEVVGYLKLKGWLETPPLYQSINKNIKEKLSTIDAYHLWDHLGYRYDNRRQTQLYQAFTFDGDYKMILKVGINQLTKHAQLLEKELQYFGIPLPKKPPEVTVSPGNTELFEDDYTYRIIMIGIQGALTIHAQALKQCTFNDRVRNIFKKLLLEEVDLLDNYIKFGKTKGWLNPGPGYHP
ncbi:MAG: hypothetical protein APF76_11290 [Desulfitibacter sp. BRH_c19]|nr:MAG: hypothetical protein APF76_11290 [Desulfitibacter sp. BRH_c19]